MTTISVRSDVPRQPRGIPTGGQFTAYRLQRPFLTRMTPEEAILQMNLLHHNFFVFRNFSNGGNFSVVYSRDGGGYGMIEES